MKSRIISGGSDSTTLTGRPVRANKNLSDFWIGLNRIYDWSIRSDRTKVPCLMQSSSLQWSKSNILCIRLALWSCCFILLFDSVWNEWNAQKTTVKSHNDSIDCFASAKLSEMRQRKVKWNSFLRRPLVSFARERSRRVSVVFRKWICRNFLKSDT